VSIMDWRFWVPIISTLVFGIATVVLALKLVKKKQPAWAYTTIPILGIDSKTPPELKLVFDGRSVDDVYRTLVIFFNAGNQTIEASDVRKQITLVFKNAKILREPKLYANDTATEFSVEWSSSGEYSEVKLGFKCLDHNDGAVMEVIHDGKGEVSCDGRIKETKEIAFLGKFTPPDLRRLPGYIIAGFVVSGVWFAMVVGLAIAGGVDLIAKPVEVAMIAVLFGMGVYLLWQNIARLLARRRFPAWSALSE